MYTCKRTVGLSLTGTDQRHRSETLWLIGQQLLRFLFLRLHNFVRSLCMSEWLGNVPSLPTVVPLGSFLDAGMATTDPAEVCGSDARFVHILISCLRRGLGLTRREATESRFGHSPTWSCLRRPRNPPKSDGKPLRWVLEVTVPTTRDQLSCRRTPQLPSPVGRTPLYHRVTL